MAELSRDDVIERTLQRLNFVADHNDENTRVLNGLFCSGIIWERTRLRGDTTRQEAVTQGVLALQSEEVTQESDEGILEDLYDAAAAHERTHGLAQARLTLVRETLRNEWFDVDGPEGPREVVDISVIYDALEVEEIDL